MKILVIIVTFNAMRWIERCFKSLETSSVVPDVFVVDNGSTDGTQVYIKDNYPNTIFQQSHKNLGFGQANNLGLTYALENNYDFVYLLNQDAWIQPDTLEKLINLSNMHPEFGLISPVQMNADLYHIDKNFFYGLCNYKNKDIINDLYNKQLRNIYETTPFVMAAHWFLTRKCIEIVGGFSPTFKHYGEDNNYAERVLFHGFKIGVAPQLSVVHDRGERNDSSRKVMYLNYIGLLITISSPNKGRKILDALVRNVYNIFKYKSFLPIYYLLQLPFKSCKLVKNRRSSMKDNGAFLNTVSASQKEKYNTTQG